MAAWKLSDDEWDALDDFRFSAKDAEAFRNATVVLMTGVGRSKFDIAEELGCSPATVDNVRRRYRQRGLEGLRRRKSPGRVSRATPEYRDALREAANTPPQSLGYGFSVWSANRLAKHLEKTTHISLGDDRVRVARIGQIARGRELVERALDRVLGDPAAAQALRKLGAAEIAAREQAYGERLGRRCGRTHRGSRPYSSGVACTRPGDGTPTAAPIV